MSDWKKSQLAALKPDSSKSLEQQKRTPPNPPPPQAPAVTSGSRLMSYRCATTGRRYSLKIARLNEWTRYTISDVQVQAPANESRGPQSNMPAISEISLDSLDYSGFCCPGCGQHRIARAQFIRCGTCNEFVCDGRSEVKLNTLHFRCHGGCTGSGPVVMDLKAVTTYQEQKPSAALPPRPQAPAISAPRPTPAVNAPPAQLALPAPSRKGRQ